MSYLGKYAGLFFGNYFGNVSAEVAVEIIPGTSSPTPGGGGLAGRGGRHDRGRGVYYSGGDKALERMIRAAVREAIEGKRKKPAVATEYSTHRYETPHPKTPTTVVSEAVLRVLGTPLFRGLDKAEEIRRVVEEEAAKYEVPVLLGYLGPAPDFAWVVDPMALLLCVA